MTKYAQSLSVRGRFFEVQFRQMQRFLPAVRLSKRFLTSDAATTNASISTNDQKPLEPTKVNNSTTPTSTSTNAITGESDERDLFVEIAARVPNLYSYYPLVHPISTLQLYLRHVDLGAVIGVRGTNIERIRMESGALVRVGPGQDTRPVILQGTWEQVCRAKSMLEEAVLLGRKENHARRRFQQDSVKAENDEALNKPKEKLESSQE